MPLENPIEADYSTDTIEKRNRSRFLQKARADWKSEQPLLFKGARS